MATEPEHRPSLTLAYDCGREAFYAGQTIDDNPHRKTSACYEPWRTGFQDAEEQHLRKRRLA